jgi:hypothetical protein
MMHSSIELGTLSHFISMRELGQQLGTNVPALKVSSYFFFAHLKQSRVSPVS